MVHDLLFYELLLAVLLWLGVHAYMHWQRGLATKQPPAQRTTRAPQAPKPFAGLTQKPHCAACEQGPERADQLPPSPPPLLVPKRGRPRMVRDTSGHYCPQKTCAYYGWAGQGNLRANGHPSGGPWRQFQCVACHTYFLETHGTLFAGKRVSAELLVQVIAALAEGLGIRAVARVFGIDPNTVLTWLSAAADQLEAFSHYLLRDVHINHVQLDELFAWVSEDTVGRGSTAKASEPCQHSPHWIWVAIDPVSKLLLAIDVGERTLAMAQRLVHRVLQVLAPGCLPLFLTDGLKEYATALLTHRGHWVPRPRRRVPGPTPKPRWMPRADLLYAQVVKQYRRRRLVRMSPRVVFGTLERVRH